MALRTDGLNNFQAVLSGNVVNNWRCCGVDPCTVEENVVSMTSFVTRYSNSALNDRDAIHFVVAARTQGTSYKEKIFKGDEHFKQ